MILQSYYETLNDRKNINDPEFHDLDALILKEMIIDLVQKNLEDSSLCYKLIDTHNNSNKNNTKDTAGDSNESVDLMPAIKFINLLELFKFNILVNANSRLRFLELILEKKN